MENRTFNINPVNAFLIILQVVFVILMVVSFRNVLTDEVVELGVGVTGLEQEIEGLPEKGKEDIEYAIYQVVAANSASNEIQKTGVVIRDGSLINDYYENMDLHYVNFIADIPEAKQSYQVVYEWSQNGENPYLSAAFSTAVMCLSKEQLIYGEFNCDTSQDYLRRTIVSGMLYGYNYTLPGYDNLSVMPGRETSANDFKVTINYLTCDTQCGCLAVSSEQRQAAISAFESFVRKLGFRLDEIPYAFDNC